MSPLPWLEALEIPFPDQSMAGCDEISCLQKHSILDTPARRPPHLYPPDDEGGLALYRWHVGHHLSVCIWRMLADLLAGLAGATSQQAGEEEAAFLFDAYSAALIYAGSCTSEIYKSVVRQKMIDVNPAMSGTWARDYDRIHRLFPTLGVAPDSLLRSAYGTNHRVHMQQAKRLVPEGGSLLQQAGRAFDDVTDVERAVFDSFFAIERKMVCRRHFYFQMARRLLQSLDDMRLKPLPYHHFADASRDFAERCEAILGRLAKSIEEKWQ